MSTQTSTRSMTLNSVKSIMQSRALITAEMVGKLVKLFIQGNGNVVDVKDGKGELVQSVAEPGTVLRKTIFNVRANSALAMQNERNKSILKAGVLAEKNGAPVAFDFGDGARDYDAHTLFSTYLNRVQVSFGILLPNTLVENLSNGVEIKAHIQRIDPTAERLAAEPNAAPILTIDDKTISLVAAISAGKTMFDIDDILGVASEVSEDAVTTEA